MTGISIHAAGTIYHPSDSDSDATEEVLNLLGGELPSQLTGYHIVNRPLGGNLPIELKQNIWKGDYVNPQVLITDPNDNEQEQQQQP